MVLIILLLYTLQLNLRQLLSTILCEELFTVIQFYDNHEPNLFSLHIWRNNYAIIFVNRFNKLLLNFICRAFKAPKSLSHILARTIQQRLYLGYKATLHLKNHFLINQCFLIKYKHYQNKYDRYYNIRKREIVKSFSLFELSNQVFCCFK